MNLNESFEAAVTKKCTRALELGRTRVKLPAAVVRQLMTELEFHEKQSEWWRVFAEKRGETITELREQLSDAIVKAKDRYEGMVTLTKMINKMGEEVEKSESRATAAETYAKQAFEERNIANSKAQAAEQNMHKYRLDAVDAGLSLASANGATRNAFERAAAAEADVLEMADAIRDLRDRVAASEALAQEHLDTIGEYHKSFHAQEALLHIARNKALEAERQLYDAELATVAATKRADEAEAICKRALHEVNRYSEFLSDTFPGWFDKMVVWVNSREKSK